DHHRPNGVHMATGKARTAAMRARPSSALEARVKERPGFLTVPNALAVRGGVPIFYRGECVGGVGISGNSHHDEVIAEGGGDALKGGRPPAGDKSEKKKPGRGRG